MLTNVTLLCVIYVSSKFNLVVNATKYVLYVLI